MQMNTSQQIIGRLKRVATIIQLDALNKNRPAVRNRGDELLALIILLEDTMKKEIEVEVEGHPV